VYFGTCIFTKHLVCNSVPYIYINFNCFHAHHIYALQKPFSPTSLRSTLSTTNRQVSVANASSASGKRRDSLSSSAGASSVRRLIEVVRTTPSNMGPVYSRRLLCRNYVTLCLGHGAAAAALVPFMALQVGTLFNISYYLHEIRLQQYFTRGHDVKNDCNKFWSPEGLCSEISTYVSLGFFLCDLLQGWASTSRGLFQYI